MKTILLFFLISTLILADNVYLKDGTIYKNVTVVTANKSTVTIKLKNSEDNFKSLPSETIERIEYVSMDEFQPTEIINSKNISPATNSSDPCNDKVLMRLQAKDSLTTDEMKIYVELKRQCTESENFNKTNKNQTQLINNLHSAQNGISAYLIISLIIGIVGMIIILAH